ETIAVRNYWYLLGSPRNRTQEADGSIPFSSTKLLVFERLASTLSARRRLALSTVSPGAPELAGSFPDERFGFFARRKVAIDSRTSLDESDAPSSSRSVWSHCFRRSSDWRSAFSDDPD